MYGSFVRSANSTRPADAKRGFCGTTTTSGGLRTISVFNRPVREGSPKSEIQSTKPTSIVPSWSASSWLSALRLWTSRCTSGKRWQNSRIIKGRGVRTDHGIQPIEKHHVQFLFQELNLLAERRLCNMESFRRTAEVKLLGHSDEILQAP